jgi:hypothetical protein
VIFIVALLHERDRGVLIAHPHVERRAARADGERAVPELTGQVKRLAQRLLLRQAQRVFGHLRLDARAHGARCTEEPVGRRESFKSLVRSLEVVVLDVQRHAALAVLEVGEHRAREQLLPQGLPEPLDLAAGLRMMGPTLHVLDAVALQFRLELRRAAPGGVLPALVGQDLPRRSVVCDATRERLEHQHASLVVRHRKTHEIPGVIVQERRHIDPLMPPEQEGEQVRLPQLIGLGPLEVLHLDLPSDPSLGHLRFDALGTQHPPHRRLGGTDPQKPPHHIADATAAGTRCLHMGCEDRFGALIGWLLEVRMQCRLLHLERLFPALPICLHPHHRRCVRHA